MIHRLPYSWRVSRHDPELRDRGLLSDVWLSHNDIGRVFQGVPLTREEYERVENLYVQAAVRFAIDVGASQLRIVYVGHQEDRFDLEPGQVLPRADIGPVVRANLRGQLDCALEALDAGFQLAFGYDLYMYVACVVACGAAVADVASSGLWLEPGVSLALWEDHGD
jgi:hypothetical protein